MTSRSAKPCTQVSQGSLSVALRAACRCTSTSWNPSSIRLSPRIGPTGPEPAGPEPAGFGPTRSGTCGRSTPAARLRSSTRRILPVAVVGKPSVNKTARGRLNDGSPSRQCSISSASVTIPPAVRTTYATGFSRLSASGAATTTAWATAGWASSRASTSIGDTQMPDALIMSPVRPRHS